MNKPEWMDGFGPEWEPYEYGIDQEDTEHGLGVAKREKRCEIDVAVSDDNNVRLVIEMYYGLPGDARGPIDFPVTSIERAHEIADLIFAGLPEVPK